MMITIVLVAVGLLALGFLIKIRKGFASPRALENPAQHLRPVDVAAFRNLIDPEEEEFLRRRLPAADYRKIRRERLRAAVDYVSCAAQNAAILLRLGEAALRSGDAATAEAATNLINQAIQLRIYAFQAIPKLYLGIIFPGWEVSSLPVADSYEQMTGQLARLGSQYPVQGVSAAL